MEYAANKIQPISANIQSNFKLVLNPTQHDYSAFAFDISCLLGHRINRYEKLLWKRKMN